MRLLQGGGSRSQDDLRGRRTSERDVDREDAGIQGPLPRADGGAVAAARRRAGRSQDQGAARACHHGVREINLATKPKVEGEAAASYLRRLLKPVGGEVTCIAVG